MNEQHGQRRRSTVAVVSLGALVAGTVAAIGVAERVSGAAQFRDVALVNAADDAHNDLIGAQVAQNNSLFDQDNALQESVYYWATQSAADGGLGLKNDDLFPGDANDPQDSIFNGAFSRFTEGMLVGQAIQQAEWDHLLGVNQTLGAGGYETAIADSLYQNLNGAGIPDTGGVHEALAALVPGSDFTSASGFLSDLTHLQDALYQNAFSDVFGMFDMSATTSTDVGSTAADAASGIDLPF